MAPGRVALLAMVVGAGFAVGGVDVASAQMMPMGPPQGEPPCMGDFVPLRTAAEKRAAAIKAGTERHAGAQEMCQLFNQFMEAEGKVLKYLESNAGWCGIPAQVVTTVRTGHTKTTEIRQKVCAAATFAGPGGERRGSGLSDALGMRTIPTPDPTTAGKGAFDTLSGNPLVK